MLSTDAGDVTGQPAGLSAVLDLTPLGDGVFLGDAQPRPRGRTFGGELVSQALVAAGRTVPEDRPAHSAHAHFLSGGDAAVPVTYRVEELRDGGSFSTRRVTAEQSDRVIFHLTASFHRAEAGFAHQPERPAVPEPELLPPAPEAFAEEDPRDRAWVTEVQRRHSLELRFPEEFPRLATRRGRSVPARQRVWLRLNDRLPDDPLVHTGALAYVSDLLLLSAALAPHRRLIGDSDLRFGSLDHTLWFHTPHRMDDWLLYAQESPWASGGRALSRGQMFDRSGNLVASTVQEGLLRPVPAAG